MANSKYGYVRSFEQPDSLLPNTFIVVRIDGRGFTKLTAKYNFVKPNDRRALDLMNVAAEAVMKELPDLVLAYGQSDEYSFVFHKDCMLFERRASKLVTTIVSTFTANYVFGWAKYFPDAPLTPPLPSFDGRAVCYPSNTNLRDYLSWRQADCHINNLYNTTFWTLVQKGDRSNREAEEELSGTVSADKNEILFSQFGINYNNEPDIFKKGSVLYRDFFPTSTQSTPTPATSAPIHQPTPQSIIRPMSEPLECTPQDMFRSSPASGASSASTPRGPTFLSTSRTPSPPPSPLSTSTPTFANTFEPKSSVGYPSTITNYHTASNGSSHRPYLPPLAPIPLPPPTLKPSTRPPPSLNPPNSIAHTNTSPHVSILGAPYPGNTPAEIPSRTTSNSKRAVKPVSHSASTSLSTYPFHPTSTHPHRPSPKRSPSMSALESGPRRAPPQIPLRISSIPPNRSPRKLSLPSQKSYALFRDPSPTANTSSHRDRDRGRPHTPPLQLMTMKELPSPPSAGGYDDSGLRGAVMGSEPQAWSQSPVLPPTRGSGNGHGEMDGVIVNPVIPPSPPAQGPTHSRSESAAGTYDFPAPPMTFGGFDWDPRSSNDAPPEVPKKAKGRERKIKEKKKEKGKRAGSEWDDQEGRPVQMSKTQKEKEKKKRGKAKVVTEHVDIIGDGFWERRPWILSGRLGGQS